jgi:hypothetical protein
MRKIKELPDLTLKQGETDQQIYAQEWLKRRLQPDRTGVDARK